MNHQVYIILVFIFLLAGCSKQPYQETEDIPVRVSSEEASTPYLTSDYKGNPVLCWTERLPGEDSHILKYAISRDHGKSFGKPITVSPSKGTTSHSESANKVAFRKDGTVIAVFQLKEPTPDNPFAGSIRYTQSFDQGKSWSAPRYLHTDTRNGIGRNFFDIATLPDGEVGAVWLDGRKQSENGSTLVFTKTSGDKGFQEDMEIAQATCECCRTNILADQRGNIHVTYRDILQDSIRDIAYLKSTDMGKTFTNPSRISADNWAINGCPHTGPSMTWINDKLHITWFTAGGKAGVYHTFSKDHGDTFEKKELISTEAMHPQVSATPEGNLIIAWDEPNEQGSSVFIQMRNGDGSTKTLNITPGNVNVNYPVLQTVDDGNRLLLSWIQQVNEKPGVYYHTMDLNKLNNEMEENALVATGKLSEQ